MCLILPEYEEYDECKRSMRCKMAFDADKGTSKVFPSVSTGGAHCHERAEHARSQILRSVNGAESPSSPRAWTRLEQSKVGKVIT